MQEREIKVGIADLNIISSPGRIQTIGLGSCIGISLYDKSKKVVGLAHIMLPDSTQFTKITNPYKYADLSIPILLEKMCNEYGCAKRNIVAKIAGGASMFSSLDKSIISDIGRRNAEAVESHLKSLGIPIVAKDIGGNKGRTMTVDAKDGTVILKVVGSGIIEL